MLPRTKTKIQPMSEANVGANFMFALRTKTKSAPISKKQCIWGHGLPSGGWGHVLFIILEVNDFEFSKNLSAIIKM